jgi:hypothetical protein
LDDLSGPSPYNRDFIGKLVDYLIDLQSASVSMALDLTPEATDRFKNLRQRAANVDITLLHGLQNARLARR